MAHLQDFFELPTMDNLAKFLEEGVKVEGRERVKLQRKLLSDPLQGLWDILSQGNVGFSGYQLLRLGMLFDPDDDLRDIKQAYEALVAFDAWAKVDETLKKCRKYFGGTAAYWALLIADRTKPDVIERFKGYTGFGSIPPYLILSFWPTTYSLVRLKSSAAREYHHMMRSSLFPVGSSKFNLADAIINEGLAEYFIEEQFGSSFVSEIATSLDREQVASVWHKYKTNLKITAMDQQRPYLYGSYTVDLPYCAGFAVGYQVVKSYVEKHKDVNSGSLIAFPATKIIQGSEFA